MIIVVVFLLNCEQPLNLYAVHMYNSSVIQKKSISEENRRITFKYMGLDEKKDNVCGVSYTLFNQL